MPTPVLPPVCECTARDFMEWWRACPCVNRLLHAVSYLQHADHLLISQILPFFEGDIPVQIGATWCGYAPHITGVLNSARRSEHHLLVRWLHARNDAHEAIARIMVPIMREIVTHDATISSHFELYEMEQSPVAPARVVANDIILRQREHNEHHRQAAKRFREHEREEVSNEATPLVEQVLKEQTKPARKPAIRKRDRETVVEPSTAMSAQGSVSPPPRVCEVVAELPAMVDNPSPKDLADFVKKLVYVPAPEEMV